MCAMCIVDYQDDHQPKGEHRIMELSNVYDLSLRQLKRRNEEVEGK